MFIVKDNFFNDQIRKNISDDYIVHQKTQKFIWIDGKLDDLIKQNNPIGEIIKFASYFFDLSSMVGFEYWAHLNKKPDWHYDKDESLNLKQIVKLPLCSIVYYPYIQNLKGGKFLTETIAVTPVENRLILFSSDTYHGVEDFTGERLCVAINPWHYKVEKNHEYA